MCHTRQNAGETTARKTKDVIQGTSQTGWAETLCWDALDGDNWSEVLHGGLIIIRDGTSEEENISIYSSYFTCCEDPQVMFT